MARILVVSRNPAMSMSLAGGEHEVDTCRPGLLDRWTQGADQCDAYILDLGEPEEAISAVAHLRATGRVGPVLLVAGSAGAWSDIDASPPPGSAVLPLPVTRPRLIAALEGLFRAPPTRAGLPQTQAGPPPSSPPTPPEPLATGGAPAVAPNTAPASAEAHTPLSLDPEPLGGAFDVTTLPDAPPEQAFQSDIPEPAAYLEPAPVEPEPVVAVPEPEPVPLPTYVPRPRPPLPPVAPPPPPPLPMGTPSELPHVPVSVGAVAAHTATASLLPEPSRQIAPPASRSHALIDAATPAMALIKTLSTRAGELYGVPETAEAVVLDALERTGAAAVALLVPDGDLWRVAAGSGLRTLESRCEMRGDTWLVQMVARARKGMLVEGSDIVRVKMSGAPLASWPHLAAAPVPTVRAIVLAARADHGFSEADLVALAALGEEAEGPLTEALAVRDLARRLDEHRNPRDQKETR